mmetsp:Transcript_5315/g.17664  ORF Transcript_5315/g.17664 Transcript_5315/m.17664 type:complete len:397 (-) Transcript_5315:550-1740(-)
MRSRSAVRSAKSCWLDLNMRSLRAMTSFCAALSRSSSWCCSLVSSSCLFSRVSSCVNSPSSLRLTPANFFLTFSRWRFFVSTSCAVAWLPARCTASSLAALASVFLTTSTSSCISLNCFFSPWNCPWSTTCPRSAMAICASSSRLFATSLSRNFAVWSSAICFSRSSSLRCANASLARWMLSSRLRMASTASSHWRTSSWRSPCSSRKSCAVLSSWICALCVSVTSASRSFFLRATSLVIFSMWRFSSLMRASSARWYLSRARLSSSFCREASAHCSSSSWFQFMRSLNWSIFSFPRYTWFWSEFIFSKSSACSFSSLNTSPRSRPASRSTSCLRWSSVSISLFFESTLLCVYTSSWRTFLRCSLMIWILSLFSSNAASVRSSWDSHDCTTAPWRR